MTKLSDAEIAEQFRQNLKSLQNIRSSASAHIAASQEMIERSSELIQQIDRIERELRWRLDASTEVPRPNPDAPL
jgi:chaperonin cofactor prefoldin